MSKPVFKIEKEEYINRTMRFPKSLWEMLSSVAHKNEVSVNSLIIECVKFALNNMEDK